MLHKIKDTLFGVPLYITMLYFAYTANFALFIGLSIYLIPAVALLYLFWCNIDWGYAPVIFILLLFFIIAPLQCLVWPLAIKNVYREYKRGELKVK